MEKPVRKRTKDFPAAICLAAVALLTVVLLTSACSPDSSGGRRKGRISITEENGVSVVRNPRAPLFGEAALDLEKVGVLGGERNEGTTFFRHIRFTIDQGGNFLVVDGGGKAVKEFDKDGRLVRTIGREGQGPGEFQVPLSCLKDEKGNVFIGELRKIQAFDPQGRFLKSVPLTLPTKAFISMGDDRLLLQTVGDASFGKEMTSDVVLVDWRGNKIRTLASRPSWMNNRIEIISEITVTVRFVNQGYAPDVVLAEAGPGRTVYACSDEYRLHVTDRAGNVSRVIEKDEAPEVISEREKDRIISDALRTKKGEKTGLDRNEAERAAHFTKFRPFIDSIICDEEGKIYVVRKRSVLDGSKRTEVDYFDREGRYLYRLTFPCETLEECLIKNGSLYRAEADPESGDIHIVQYRIKGIEKLRKYPE